jgi:hypothetical protein
MSDNTTWLMSLRESIMGRESPEYKKLYVDSRLAFYRQKRQLEEDIERLNNVIKDNKHYAEILSATIDLLRAKIDLLETNNIKPLNRSKRK